MSLKKYIRNYKGFFPLLASIIGLFPLCKEILLRQKLEGVHLEMQKSCILCCQSSRFVTLNEIKIYTIKA
ncbi:unnamed protein product [Hymenolepis diminuta]|uniref:Uncharacterized protein n=1 Tax=Hymenolepis diminuta TaxID=6216 RepID=A0A564XXF1_HYMDI|nr:unnamed protein product [Hymenolepis diminuta]